MQYNAVHYGFLRGDDGARPGRAAGGFCATWQERGALRPWSRSLRCFWMAGEIGL